MPVYDLAGWVSILAAFAGGIAYLSRQIDAKLSTDKYEARHRELEERMRKLELWASKKSYNAN